MHIQEPVSKWPGRVRLAAASLAASAGLAGCTLFQSQPQPQPPAPPPPPPQQQAASTASADLELLDRALGGTTATREALWRETQAADRGQNTQLRIALLQSVPDSPGYDPAAAQRGLRALLAQNPPEEIAVVARVRLSEIKSSSQCLGEAQDLRRRLAQVVDIERHIDGQQGRP